MTLKKMKNREIIRINQDRNKEQMSLVATIYVVAIKILSILIYQGECRNLQDSQAKNVDINTVYFIATLIRQSNNNIKRW